MNDQQICDNLALAALKKVVEEHMENGSLPYFSQIYSWFDLDLEGCMSPTDYPQIAELHTTGEFYFHFLWGCVENCVVIWQPPVVPVPPISEWPLLAFDNEGYVGYAGSSREAVARLMKSMEMEAERESGRNDENSRKLVAFVADVVRELGLMPFELEAAQQEQQGSEVFANEISELASLAVM
jgi:hypothetical protein